MKKIIVSKVEYEFIIFSLEELYEISPDETISDKWLSKLESTRKLFDLELGYYNIRSDNQNPTKKETVKWLLEKIKNKNLDL
jgi:alpha-L-fucosidase